MLRYWLRVTILLLLSSIVFIVSAQETTTTRTPDGFLVDHPADWNISFPDGRGDVIVFDDGVMFGFISMLNFSGRDTTPMDVISDLVEEIQEDGEGEFEPIETYTINGDIPAASAIRLLESNNLQELLIAADVNEISVFVRASFRVGSRVDYEPIFESLIASVVLEGREPQQILVGSPDNLLDFTTLNTTATFEDRGFSFDHPENWNITEQSDSIQFLGQGELTVIGLVAVNSLADYEGDATPESILQEELEAEGVLADFGEIEGFSLNGLPSARSYREDDRAGTTDLVSVTLRGDFVVVFAATINTNELESAEPILRAMQFSVRPAGEELQYNIVGSGARLGLTSGLVYGGANLSGDADLPNLYQSNDGAFSFNYPIGWFVGLDPEGALALSNQDDIEDVLPDEGQVIIYIFTQTFTGLLTSPESILRDINEENDLNWGEIQTLDIGGADAAYAENDPSDFGGLVLGSYVLELVPEDDLYLRASAIAEPDVLAEYTPIIRQVLASARFERQ